MLFQRKSSVKSFGIEVARYGNIENDTEAFSNGTMYNNAHGVYSKAAIFAATTITRTERYTTAAATLQ